MWFFCRRHFKKSSFDVFAHLSMRYRLVGKCFNSEYHDYLKFFEEVYVFSGNRCYWSK